MALGQLFGTPAEHGVRRRMDIGVTYERRLWRRLRRRLRWRLRRRLRRWVWRRIRRRRTAARIWRIRRNYGAIPAATETRTVFSRGFGGHGRPAAAGGYRRAGGGLRRRRPLADIRRRYPAGTLHRRNRAGTGRRAAECARRGQRPRRSQPRNSAAPSSQAAAHCPQSAGQRAASFRPTRSSIRAF